MSRGRFTHPGEEATEARESCERRWFRHFTPRPELGALATGAGLADEPFHRWLPYKQAFSPGLVRIFLAEAQGIDDDAPLLDPFAGTGTCPVECARCGRAAIGVDALASLAFVARAKGEQKFLKTPNVASAKDWREIARLLTEPLHRAALICAVAAQHTSEGKLIEPTPPLVSEFARVLRMMRADLARPLAAPFAIHHGDARTLDMLGDESVGGVLTSPPYLSRHDYTRIAQPHETTYEFWYGGDEAAQRRERQVSAHPKAYARVWSEPLPLAAAESCEQLRANAENKLAGVARSYFEDMRAALAACARVLRRGAPCWVVVGGARLKDVYVPADLILAEIGEAVGFEVAGLLEARRLIDAGRRLGGLPDVAPRETVVVLQKA